MNFKSKTHFPFAERVAFRTVLSFERPLGCYIRFQANGIIEITLSQH